MCDRDSIPPQNFVRTKVCTKCGSQKTATTTNFHVKAAGLFGLHSICRSCRNLQATAWAKQNPQRTREIQREAKSRIRKTPEGRKKLVEINAKYVKNNRERVSEYYRSRRQSDPVYAASSRVRGLVRKAFGRRKVPKNGAASAILGCDWDTLKAHIESLFKDGMSWDRFGEIHIDHVIPLASAKTEIDVLRLNHYTNLQPLWAADNIRKGAKMPETLKEHLQPCT